MSPLVGRQRCTGAQKKGLPCKNLAVAGLLVCRWHGDERSLEQVSPDILAPAVKRHLRELQKGIEALEEIARLRAWRDYVEDYINKKTGGKPTPADVKVMIEANKIALTAVEAQTRIEYNKANVITQKDAAQFISVIIGIARQTIRNHSDLTRFLEQTGQYFHPQKLTVGRPNGDESF